MHMKVQLILPSTKQLFLRDKWMMPLGLLSIATYFKTMIPLAQVEVIDGKLLPEEAMIDKVDGDIVGLSINIANLESAKTIAHLAKMKGAIVVAGGTLATSDEKLLHENIQDIDVVIRGDGEEAFVVAALGRTSSDVHHQTNLNELPTIDRTFVDAETYFSAYQTLYPYSPYKRPLTLYTQKGCRYKQRKGGCKFCSIADRGWRARNPRNIWQEIHLLLDAYKTDLIWDISDSIAGDISWLNEFVSTKPEPVNCDFYFYIRADEVSEYSARLLASINCKRVFLGIESGNDNLLLEANKGSNTKTNLQAAQILSRHNIGIHLSFILGFPCESEKTIENTKHHIQQLLPYGVEVLTAHVMTPEPGSAYFSMLSKRIDKIALNPSQLCSRWAEQFCESSVEDMYEACEEILSWLPGEQERDYREVVSNE